jgi:hypothetical protein
MKCDEQIRLLGAYNQATFALTTAVQDLLNGGEVVANTLYALHRRAAEKARVEFEAARLAYETHLQEHHCGSEAGAGAGLEVMLDSV